MRFKYPTDPGEMDRRWKVTLEAMNKEGIDVLILAEYDRVYGGIAKYLTDVAVPLYAMQFLFSKDGIVIMGHGGEGGKAAPDYVATRNILGNYSFTSLASTVYGDTWYPEKMAEIIKKYGYKKAGWVGLNYIPAATYKYLTEYLPDVEFVDFTDRMDYIKAVKSEWELGEFKKIVKLHDDIMACVPTILRVGKTEKQVADEIRNISFELDCPEVNVILGTHPTSPILNPYMYSHEVIEKGHCFQLLIELAGPGGFWAECGRMCSLGEPPAIMKQAFKDQIEIQAASAAKMVPGAMPGDVQDFINKMYLERGYFKEMRFGTHGQSYDIVDRPMFVKEETMPLAENMFIAHHPTCYNDNVSCYNCDNYQITKNGAIKLSATPSTLIVCDY